MDQSEIKIFKQKALSWANRFEVCCCLDSNHYTDAYSEYDYLIAVGAQATLQLNAGTAFEALKKFHDQHQNWLFGLFSYELKNEIETLTTKFEDQLQFPDLFFFVPQYLIALQGDEIKVVLGDTSILQTIAQEKLNTAPYTKPDVIIQRKFERDAYLETIEQLQVHIKRGDIYEINVCQEFFAAAATIDPLAVYEELNSISPSPFAGFFKIYDKYLLSATPERFLCKRGEKLISQPIKGTARRSTTEKEDLLIKKQLQQSAKEQAENVMIVDLVRNDLTKSALQGTVKVEELFGIYSFPQVHQMISTISCTLDPKVHLIDAIKNTFPMGSMTGAPKVKAMELIDTYEKSKRGAFSGSFGCISPDGNFDFNVIIRSLLYNETSNYLSYQVGGAITYAANAAEEYEECLLKASAIRKVLTGAS